MCVGVCSTVPGAQQRSPLLFSITVAADLALAVPQGSQTDLALWSCHDHENLERFSLALVLPPGKQLAPASDGGPGRSGGTEHRVEPCHQTLLRDVEDLSAKLRWG